jgi:hypothetical protein
LLARMCQIYPKMGNWWKLTSHPQGNQVWSEGYVATPQAAETNVYDGSKVACEFAFGDRTADAAASVKEKVLVTAWCRVCTGWKATVAQMYQVMSQLDGFLSSFLSPVRAFKMFKSMFNCYRSWPVGSQPGVVFMMGLEDHGRS